MADITSQVSITGGGQTQAVEYEPQWHMFEVRVPAALLAAGTDDVVLRRYPDPRTRLLDVIFQVAQVTDVGTSCTIDFEKKVYTVATDSDGSPGNLLTGINGLTLETDAFSAGGTSLGGFGSGLTEGVTEATLNVEITNVGTTATVDLIVVAAALLARASY